MTTQQSPILIAFEWVSEIDVVPGGANPTSGGQGSEAPVIIITAKGTDAIRERAEQAGCAAFLTKPFHGETILGLLASFVRQSPP